LTFVLTVVATSAQNQGTMLRADTRLVEVNALVLDKDGRPLDGLTRGDFTVYEDGKDRRSSCSPSRAVRGRLGPTLAAAPSEPGVPLPSGEYSNRVVVWAGGVTVILLDRLNTTVEDRRQARDQIVQFLKNVGREDRIALYVLESNSIRILHDFTRDNASLIAALARFQAKTSRATQATDAMPIADAKSGNASEDAGSDAWLQRSTKEVSAFFIRNRVRSTEIAFVTIASRRAVVRGRKCMPSTREGWSRRSRTRPRCQPRKSRAAKGPSHGTWDGAFHTVTA
jgi:VWFA-related protein